MPRDFWKVCTKSVQQVLVLHFCECCLLLQREIVVVTQLQQLMHQFCVCARSSFSFKKFPTGNSYWHGEKIEVGKKYL